MTRCKKVDSKSDKIKILLFQNHAFYNNFSFKIMLFRKKIFLRIVIFKIARNTQKMRIFRGKLNQNVLLCVQHFFQNLLFKINFSSKSCLLKKFFFFKIMLFKNIFLLKSWRVVYFSIQNLTRCKKVDSKSDKMKNFYFKIMLFTKIFHSISCFLEIFFLLNRAF